MISNILMPENIKINMESTEQEECIAELVEKLVATNPEIDRNQVLSSLLAREEQMSTAIYPFVAVPHAVCKNLKNTSIAIGISRSGIEFENPDKNNPNPVKVHVVFQVVFEEEDTNSRQVGYNEFETSVECPDCKNEIVLN